ncbi:hypothetical protein ACFQH9_05480, partial [Pseudonocardia lutea]
PGPLPTPTGAHVPARPPVRSATPTAAAAGGAAIGLPTRWALPLAVAGALLVLLGAAGGYSLVRSLAGQSPASTVTVTTDRSPTTVHSDPAGWSLAVPSNWTLYRTDPVVRFVSADGSEALAVWRAGSEQEITAGLTAAHLGVDAVDATPAEPVAGAAAGVDELHYTTTQGSQRRTTVLRTLPAADGLWALSLTVPADRAGERSEALFAALATSFTTPAAG